VSVAVRRASVTAITVGRMVGRDGQGKPDYQDQGTVMGRVVREDHVVKLPGGEEVATQYTAWIDGAESPLPLWHDRIWFETLGEERTAIVEDHFEGQRLDGTVDHVRVRCREE
jgi:hypothetical protein